jgi:hypothetical protein
MVGIHGKKSDKMGSANNNNNLLNCNVIPSDKNSSANNIVWINKKNYSEKYALVAQLERAATF